MYHKNLAVKLLEFFKTFHYINLSILIWFDYLELEELFQGLQMKLSMKVITILS